MATAENLANLHLFRIDAIGRKSKSTTDGVIESDTSAGQTSSGKHPAFLPSVVITRFVGCTTLTSNRLTSTLVK